MSLHNRTLIVTKMKNEGPFILEWLAYHLSIGIQDFLVYSNDCNDGTDFLLELLDRKGLIQHRKNPFREMGKSLHQAVYLSSRDEEVYKKADWIVTIDVDEFINVTHKDGLISDLYSAVPDANAISMTWRLFGNNHIHAYRDEPVIDQFTRCSPKFCPRPMKAWCFKTMFKNNGLWGRLDTHRPKQFNEERRDELYWVNGSGRRLENTNKMIKDQRRSSERTYGSDIVSINHYAVRSAQSFVVKSDRGDAIETLEIGENYWFNLNHNNEEDYSILSKRARMMDILKDLMADKQLRAVHEASVKAHRRQIAKLIPQEPFRTLYQKITSNKMQRLSEMHGQFGQTVYLPEGYEKIPDELTDMNIPRDHVFTAKPSEHFPNPNVKLFQLDPFYEPAEMDHWRAEPEGDLATDK